MATALFKLRNLKLKKKSGVKFAPFFFTAQITGNLLKTERRHKF